MGRLVEIARFFDPEEAYCAQSFLRANGVETFLANDHHLTVQPWLRVALGGYSLYAPSEVEAEARAALNDVRNAHREPETPAAAETGRRRNWLWLPFAFLTDTPFIPTYRSVGVFIAQILLLTLAAAAPLIWFIHRLGAFLP